MKIVDYEVIKKINDLEAQVDKVLESHKDEMFHRRISYFINFSGAWKKCRNELTKLEGKVDNRIFCLYYEKLCRMYPKIVDYMLLGGGR